MNEIKREFISAAQMGVMLKKYRIEKEVSIERLSAYLKYPKKLSNILKKVNNLIN